MDTAMTGVERGEAHWPKVASGPSGALRLAVTERFAVVERVQVPVPVQSPDQLSKVWPLAAAVVRMTLVPLG
jgi:hypothetical protein